MKENKVYVIQEVAGTQSGSPKINIMGANGIKGNQGELNGSSY